MDVVPWENSCNTSRAREFIGQAASLYYTCIQFLQLNLSFLNTNRLDHLCLLWTLCYIVRWTVRTFLVSEISGYCISTKFLTLQRGLRWETITGMACKVNETRPLLLRCTRTLHSVETHTYVTFTVHRKLRPDMPTFFSNPQFCAEAFPPLLWKSIMCILHRMPICYEDSY